MKFRLSRVDELSRQDHSYLTENDECWYFGEYTAYKNWSYSSTNQLIRNFKKEVSLRNTTQWQYKVKAIKEVGKLFASLIRPDSDLSNLIFVPVPPSKITTDPGYDPRMVQALQAAADISGIEWPICECVAQQYNTEPDHLSGQTRLSPKERADTYDVRLNKIPPDTHRVVIVDDVLTTGSHYKGVELAIKSKLPAITVTGLFIARRVPPNPFEDISGIDIAAFFDYE